MLAGRPATLVPVADVPALGRALQQSLATLGGQVSRPRIAYDLSAYDRRRAVQQVLSFYNDLRLQRSGGAALSSQHAAALHV